MTDGGKYFAIYCRLSKAVNGQVESVERQERWGRAYAERVVPGEPIRVFRDNDKSAFDDDTFRPDYEALREEVRAGRVSGIWCKEQARIEANRRRWIEFVAELDDAGLEVLHTDRDGLVRLDEIADMKNILSWHERKRLRRRVNDTLGDLATEGRPGPGKTLGYRHKRNEDKASILVLVEAEAVNMRWAAQALLSGWTQTDVGHEFERRGVVGRLGGTRWSGNQIRKMLSSPTIAGYRVHQGQIVGRGNWDPILDKVTWRRLQAMFGQRDRPEPARSYLLSCGLAFCGRCDIRLAGMRTRSGRHSGHQYFSYVCQRAYHDGCGGLKVMAHRLEAHVADVFLRHLDSAEFRAHLAAGDPHADERDRITAELAGLQVRRLDYARRAALSPERGGIREDEWAVMRATFDEEHRVLNELLAEIPPPPSTIDIDAVLATWPDLTLGERRHLLGRFLSRVVVYPATARGPRFDTERVHILDTEGRRLT